jgi:hypothetical protein
MPPFLPESAFHSTLSSYDDPVYYSLVDTLSSGLESERGGLHPEIGILYATLNELD